MEEANKSEVARIGKSLIIKGSLSGEQDVWIDGKLEGPIELKGHVVTVGRTGELRADITAKGVTIEGRLEGNIHALDKVTLTKSAVAVGDIQAQRILIEDGAYYKGTVNLERTAKDAAAGPGK